MWRVSPILLLGAAALAAPPAADWEAQRLRMVATQLEARDISNRRVLEAMRSVSRHLFVPERRHSQRPKLLRGTDTGIESQTLFDVRFVPMTEESQKRD